jgi:hypothetical protein
MREVLVGRLPTGASRFQLATHPFPLRSVRLDKSDT